MASSFKAIGDEIQVNTYSKSHQGDPAIAANPKTGGFQIVWESKGQDGDGYGIYGQTFGALGAMVDGEFRINDMTVGDQENPDVAFNRAGQGSWVWQTDAIWSETNINRDELPVSRDYEADNIRTRSKTFGFDGDGDGEEYYNFERVRYGRTDPEAEGQDALEPRVISLGGDMFATGYYVRDYLHAEFQFTVDEYTANTYRLPTNGQWSRNYMDTEVFPRGATNFGDLAQFDDENILVVGTLAADAEGADGIIQFQLFEEPRVQGLAFDLSERFVLEGSGTTGAASDPRVVMLVGKQFAITWTETTGSGKSAQTDVYAQIFSKKTLKEASPVIQVHSDSGEDQDHAEITALKDGGFMVTWVAGGDADGNGSAIMAQRFDADGVRLGKAQVVNATTKGDQADPAIDTLKNGNVAITWESETGDDSGLSVKAQVLKIGAYGAKKAQDLFGTSADEVFDTGARKDRIDGGGGKDKILAGAGNDRLDGGADNDVLKGGGGKDVFVFGLGSGKDKILDFADDTDRVLFDKDLMPGRITNDKLADIVTEAKAALIFDFGDGDVLRVNGISDFSDFRDDWGAF
ncbi:calcium-binding protein [Pseudodonghicola flavimaris]|uniref:Calcium-binding protein n=1 Tax=Pseudodonghicola flavimaris TaxID=3050036 RepID=A0ABT7F846_9RHOB|nr:hypothetical protein [Pseudodonghicola flavimaris]MDK3020660.1 hypothetical protein [Pseudodonghicola flavimaris]